jgi:hypothetical protein
MASRSEALDLLDDRDVRRLVRAGALVRLRPGEHDLRPDVMAVMRDRLAARPRPTKGPKR